MEDKTYAGIGSRRTPASILAIMTRLGSKLAKLGFTLQSGHAPGADKAFEAGCDAEDGDKDIFIPWEGFEGSKSILYPPRECAHELARRYYPRWNGSSQGVRKLMARNSHQVMGWDLNSPVKFVIYWAVHKRTTLGKLYKIPDGGTGQAIRIADAYSIPFYCLGTEACDDFLQSLKITL